MEAKCFSLNQRLLDQSEKRFLEADLNKFLATAESPELLEDENQSPWELILKNLENIFGK